MCRLVRKKKIGQFHSVGNSTPNFSPLYTVYQKPLAKPDKTGGIPKAQKSNNTNKQTNERKHEQTNKKTWTKIKTTDDPHKLCDS